jgi:hypothetical protein
MTLAAEAPKPATSSWIWSTVMGQGISPIVMSGCADGAHKGRWVSMLRDWLP